MKRLDRNDTSFPVKLSEYVKSIRSDTSYPFLKYYQNIVRLVLSGIDMKSRGLLIDHEMGLGKSILAIAAAIDMMPDRQPIILLAKSLAENMRSSIHKYVKMRAEYDPEWPIGRFSPSELDSWISANFSFVSMNASNMLTQVRRAVSLDKKIGDVLEQVSSLDGKLLIVDEAHNLFRAIVNGSKNGIGLYHLVQKSKNLKIIFLTGTPIANDPFELVPCFNMLSPGIPVLPEDYIEFNRLYVGEDGRCKNREKFQNRLFGLVSSIKYKWLNAVNTGEFPERLPLITVRVRMDHVQYTSYSLAREKEKEESSRPGRGTSARVALVKPKSRGSSTYRVKSRQLGNFDPSADTLEEIENPTSPKYEAIFANINKHNGQKGLVYSQFVGMGGLAPFRKFLDNHGWSSIEIGSIASSSIEETDETGDTDEPVEIAKSTNNIMQSEETTKTPTEKPTEVPESTTDESMNIVGSYSTAALPSAMDYIEHMMVGAGDTTTGWWLGGVSPRKATDMTKSEDLTMNLADSMESIDSTDITGVAYGSGASGSKSMNAAVRSEYDIIAMMNEGTNTVLPISTIPMPTIPTNLPTQSTGSAEGKTYVVISGEVDIEDRTRVQEMFNDPNSNVQLIIVSSTGAEGLDLKRVRHIHIMEPYWNWGRIEQIISRGVRNDSHIDLPADQKNVQAYIYLAIPPESEDDGSPTTDVELYEDALKNRDSVSSFLDAIDEVSIECTLDQRKCRTCNPTGEPLYSNDPSKDVRTRDPCTPYKEEEMQASEITIDGVVYQYVESKSSVYGVKVFEFDSELGAYKQLKESNHIYQRVYAELNPESE